MPYTAIFGALQQTFGPAASRKSTGQKIMGFIEALAQGNSSGGNNAYGACYVCRQGSDRMDGPGLPAEEMFAEDV